MSNMTVDILQQLRSSRIVKIYKETNFKSAETSLQPSKPPFFPTQLLCPAMMPVRPAHNDLKLELKFFALRVAIQGISAAKFFLSVQNGTLAKWHFSKMAHQQNGTLRYLAKILAPKFFLSVQNGTLKMACHFVAKIPCQNFGTKILAKSPKWHIRKWHAKVWQVDEQTQ